jgi:signal transduction histidine kinase
VKRLTRDDAAQGASIAELEWLISAKLGELQKTIELYEAGQPAAALAIVQSDQGKSIMDSARRAIGQIRTRADELLQERTAKARRTFVLAMWIDGCAGLGLLALGGMLFRINRDLARRKALEKELREVLAFQEQFVGILGHDLRNPLGAISMSAELLLRSGALPEQQSVSAKRISTTAARMNRLVAQLLDLTLARRAGGIPIEARNETNLSQVVTGAVEELRAAHPAADIQLVAAADVLGRWDADRIAQVITNLVGNAIAYGTGPVHVRVSDGRASALLEVHNGGPPIAADRLPRIFEAFRRAGDDRGTPARGLGLGLFIAEQIVAAHGGKIEVRSGDSEGTTFSVRLPRGSA